MSVLPLQEFHQSLGAAFTEVNGQSVAAHYGDALREHAVLRETVGVLDLGCRGRLCLTGADRRRFINGQVTNNVQALRPGEGCYAALITAKGKMVSDLNIYVLADEILLDFEPGLTSIVTDRLEKYIIADDVQVLDVSALYGLLSVQGPKVESVLQQFDGVGDLPVNRMSFLAVRHEVLGEMYLMNRPRLGTLGFDLFVPTAGLRAVADQLIAAAKAWGGGPCGWQALEIGRIEAGIPRFGIDMDEANLPSEAGLEDHAISSTKGCYIGQEVIARLRTYGQVARALRGLRLDDELGSLPVPGDRLVKDGKEVGFITSAIASPTFQAYIALGYVRRESNQVGTELTLHTSAGASRATIVPLPFALGPQADCGATSAR